MTTAKALRALALIGLGFFAVQLLRSGLPDDRLIVGGVSTCVNGTAEEAEKFGKRVCS